MAKHVTVIPDCPRCGEELSGVYKNLPPFDEEHPFGHGVDGWWECDTCGYESDHFDHKPYSEVREEVVR